MWPDVEAFVTPNLGATERWVPYHTILGVHEIFLVQHVHDRKECACVCVTGGCIRRPSTRAGGDALRGKAASIGAPLEHAPEPHV